MPLPIWKFMKRDTKTIKTPNGYEVEIKTWLTGRERQAINNILLDKSEIDTKDGGKIKMSNEVMVRWQNESIKQYVESIKDVDGKNIDGEIIDTLLDLRENDFSFVLEEINKLSQDEIDKVKK